MNRSRSTDKRHSAARRERMPAKCPDPLKGVTCDICGSAYICTQSWRKKRTVKQRIAARREFYAARSE